MNGCSTCGGFGDRHDSIAHGLEPRGCEGQERGLCDGIGCLECGGDELDELAYIVRLYMTNQTAAEKRYRAALARAARTTGGLVGADELPHIENPPPYVIPKKATR